MIKKIFQKREKIAEYFLASIFFPLSIFFVIIIRIIRPIFLIRYAYIISTRIGEMVENFDFYLCAKKERLFFPKQRFIDIFYLNTYVCNKFFIKMLKKKIIILPRFLMHPVDKINRFFDKFLDSEDIHTVGRYKKDLTITPKPPWNNRDIYSFLEKYGPQFEFTNKELDRGYSILKNMGINKSDKFVCLFSRDSEYLKRQYPTNDWSYHDFRNIDINLFIPSTKLLIDEGYKVVRIGNIVEKKMDLVNKNFIDYPLTKFVQDFMDIFLQAKCSFTISNGSGIDCIASTFRRKLVFPCVCPIMDTKSSTDRHLVGYRHLIDKNTMKKLSLKEIIDKKLGFIYHDRKKVENIELEEIKSENLKEIIYEMILRDKNKFIETTLSKDLEKKFFDLFKKLPKSNPLNGLWHPETSKFKISHAFLNDNQWWLD